MVTLKGYVSNSKEPHKMKDITNSPKIVFKAECAGRTFSIMRFLAEGKRVYLVSESGQPSFFKSFRLEEAMEVLTKRMHLVFAMNESA
jgi:hypothetical protein